MVERALRSAACGRRRTVGTGPDSVIGQQQKQILGNKASDNETNGDEFGQQLKT